MALTAARGSGVPVDMAIRQRAASRAVAITYASELLWNCRGRLSARCARAAFMGLAFASYLFCTSAPSLVKLSKAISYCPKVGISETRFTWKYLLDEGCHKGAANKSHSQSDKCTFNLSHSLGAWAASVVLSVPLGRVNGNSDCHHNRPNDGWNPMEIVHPTAEGGHKLSGRLSGGKEK